MIRLLNYCLLLSCLCALLIIIIPLGINMYDLNIATASDLRFEEAKAIASPFYKTELTVSLPILFLIISSVILGLVWYYWIKLNYTPKKVHDFPVDKKWISKFTTIPVLGIIMIVNSFIFFMVGLGIDVGIPQDINQAEVFAKIRWWIYIAGLVVSALLSLGIMGYNSYINLMISYAQQKQYVDQQIELGNYDPITRRPKDEAIDVSEQIKEDQSKPIDENSSNSTDSYYGSSGLVKEDE